MLVSDVAELISTLIQLPVGKFEIRHQLKIMVMSECIRTYNVQRDDTLFVSQRLLGGMIAPENSDEQKVPDTSIIHDPVLNDSFTATQHTAVLPGNPVDILTDQLAELDALRASDRYDIDRLNLLRDVDRSDVDKLLEAANANTVNIAEMGRQLTQFAGATTIKLTLLEQHQETQATSLRALSDRLSATSSRSKDRHVDNLAKINAIKRLSISQLDPKISLKSDMEFMQKFRPSSVSSVTSTSAPSVEPVLSVRQQSLQHSYKSWFDQLLPADKRTIRSTILSTWNETQISGPLDLSSGTLSQCYIDAVCAAMGYNQDSTDDWDGRITSFACSSNYMNVSKPSTSTLSVRFRLTLYIVLILYC
jgi:hypothetical protein